MSASEGRRVAVVGSGVTGLVAAYVASRTAHVTLYEADDRLGGHADTHLVDGLAIDTGFIVHNERTYPVLLRLFGELGVETQESEMSMSISDAGTGLEWAGALGRAGVVPTLGHLANPRYVRMLTEIPRFHRRARALLTRPGDDLTLRAFLEVGGFTPYFARHFMEPLVAAVWSCDPAVSLDYPARYLFSFLEHHGMLAIFGSPTWRTVTGGSREYVARVAAALADAGAEVRTGTKVTSLLESPTGVELTDGSGAITSYDAVVVATHPGQALALLAQPTPRQAEVLGALPYSPNVALLHTDTSVLPRLRNTWASWNFHRPREERDGVTVTYDLTRLQRLPTDTHYLVTLGGEHLVDPDLVIDRIEYEHPLYNPASVAAQARLPEIDSDRVSFAGAYHGWGFHEDGARSGLAAVERLGLAWDAPDPTLVEVRGAPAPTLVEVRGAPAPSLETRLAKKRPRSRPSYDSPGFEAQDSVLRTSTSVLYDTTIRHTRRQPFGRSFTHRSHTWLVDLDDLPDHGARSWLLGSFEARDHLGSPEHSLRVNVDTFLAAHGEERPERILMAAHPRTLGHCFNPISVFWCLDSAGRRQCVVVEVHNTYGDRHAYLVHPDEQGRASTPKAMYVSPFHGTDGHYELAVPLPGERLRVAVTLHSDDGATFSATLDGTRSADGPVRAAGATLRGAALIRVHGVWLWLRRLPLRSRPRHHQEGVS
ncbi:FAD-dependent oxidoreductase [Nocardioides sp. W7]|uniref:FAD-dependent oxidoreductase n=1 Tax=Nocardioides sp. W7 TaxID=2931390 RepID=UPI001FD55E22|nr:FAD-dependent oxidoreductase [Nocardioides sp. W7]